MTAALAPRPETFPLVLIALSYPDEREMYQEQLEWSGYRVDLAADADGALAAARARVPALVILDERLPGDAFKVCAELRADPRTAAVKLVMLASTRVRSPRACDALLYRPCAPEQMAARIDMLVPRTEPYASER
jgi:DNA-binding response OmpR family regulator